MSLRGHLSTLSVPEALQFLGSNQRTGTLLLETGIQRKELVLQGGSIAFCSAGRPKERLGHHVLARTSVTESHLDAAFQAHDRTGRRLGELLVDDGRIREPELQSVLRTKLEDSVHDLFTWSAGTFEWKEAQDAPEVPARLDLDWRDALLGGGERVDKTTAALARLGGRGSELFVANWQDVFASDLSVRDRDLVTLASHGLSVVEACAVRHETDFEVLSSLAWLVAEGLLGVRRTGDEDIEPPPPGRGLSLARAWLDQGRLLDAMDLLADLERRHPADPDVGAMLRSTDALVRTRIERDLGGLAVIPQANFRETLDLRLQGARQRAVLERVNGEWPLASLVRICPLGELETLLIVRELFRGGVLSLLPGRAVRPLGEPEPEDLPAPGPKPRPQGLAGLEPGPGNRHGRRIGVSVGLEDGADELR